MFRKIIHVDMDYFFAQVEILDRPQLKNKPVAIGGPSSRRGVLSTCNYIAREYGVKSAMPTYQALQKCPNLIILGSNFSKYREASDKILKIFKRYTNKIQVVSIDEAYLDVTDCELFYNSATLIAQDIRDSIFKETGLTASAGVSFNKMLAKIASDINKPNGMYVFCPENYKEKILNLNIKSISGVGKVTQKKLEKFGIITFSDAQSFSKLDLINLLGSYGPTLYEYCRGEDNREVKIETERKSLSVERTFIEDLSSLSELKTRLEHCFEEMQSRLLNHKDRFIKTIFIKIKYSNFEQTTIEQACNLVDFPSFFELFVKRFSETLREVRLIGVGVKFYSNNLKGQLSFDPLINGIN